MSKFHIESTFIKDLFIIKAKIFEDDRGFFMESYNKKEFSEIGLGMNLVQDNHSQSKKGVLRGIHFQIKHPQGKLVRVLKGSIYDVAVDLRKNSKTYSKYFGIELSSENKSMFYIPEGFGHGFLSLEDNTVMLYKTTEYFCSKCDSGIRWDDRDINIDWHFEKFNISRPIISEKDLKLANLRDITLAL